MTATTPNHAIWQQVEAFHRKEVQLLQDRRYREWLDLMDKSISYRVPVTTFTTQGLVARDDQLGYYDENFELLEARVAKLESKQSWVEQPPSRLRYFVQLVDLSQSEGQTLVARSNLLLLQHRWNMEQQFSGERTDTFELSEQGLRLKKRLVILDRQAVANQGLSVFF
ncbi:aromatic-ring-hydroxylating dioxygenase subunit beta [Cupriavidus pinatubonensis]|uniref:aromatic-ring-hydroxylating dioxygenase subunit beta n=1 Tax=Cupriavidus pinatubonensis TaxID=248026 RepID=UPI001C731B98|nr:aromatic-ring-hydroxylating dioxygenase subunit beta [Cupriavidus pinatubonensis]QYY30866.1 aromatic-ring-hydroxylating dioxygenase subunit beta [Cupriavidus pinatubonensis]